MTVWVDGAVAAGTAGPALPPGAVAPFETIGAVAGELPLWERHVRRLAAAACGRLPSGGGAA